MKQTWRWFGPADPIPLGDLHQVGVQGIVTALHQFAPGIEWPVDEIEQRQQAMRTAGFEWDVVESLPVSEAIKTQSPDMQGHLATYKTSLQSLAAAGIKTVCYNFMPILDWTRTNLREPQDHGGTAMSFDLVDFATFDLFILKRKGAKADFPTDVYDAAAERFARLSDAQRTELQNNIVAGLPGANDNWSVSDVRDQLDTYRKISPDRLKGNLIDFLAEVAPVAETLGIRLCCHPDDPPFNLLGLPRVMSNLDDYKSVLDAIDVPANGATLCTGSLGVAASFDPVAFVEQLGPRIHFVHLRNTKRTNSLDPKRPNFYEAAHLEGDTDMVATISALMSEEARRKAEGRSDHQIPMRPDHGQELLSDLGGHSTPGYPLVGRMRGLAELRGIMAAVKA